MPSYYGYGLRSVKVCVTRNASEIDASGLPQVQYYDGFSVPEVADFIAQQQALDPIYYTGGINYVASKPSRFARRFWYGSPLESLYKSGTIEYIKETARDDRYLDHVRDGKIVFLPYATGRIDWDSTGSHDMATATYSPSGMSQGWYSPAEIGLASSIRYMYGTVVLIFAGYEFYETGSLIPPLDLGSGLRPFPEEFRAVVDTGCVTEAVADANDGFWDLLTECAELPDTLGFMKGTLEQLVGFSEEHLQETDRELKRWKKPLRQLPNWLSKRWLQYRYAIMPLVYSVQDIGSVLENLHRDFITTKSKRSDLYAFLSPMGFSEPLAFTDRCIVKRSYEGMSELGRLYAMVQMNPVKTLYELTAFSFVLDWALNISDFLSATLSPEIYSQQAACYSRRIQSSAVSVESSRETHVSSEPKRVTHVSVDTYHRIPLQPSDHIGLDLNVSYGWKRQVDSVALSYQLLSSRINQRSMKSDASVQRQLGRMGYRT